MEIKFYDTAAENILHNFIEPGFKFATVSSKNLIITKFQELCPFKVICDKNYEILIVNLGEIIVKYKLTWTMHCQNNHTRYNLIDIQILS